MAWKSSEKTPLTTLACQAIHERALARFGDAPTHLSQVVVGGNNAGIVTHSADLDMTLQAAD